MTMFTATRKVDSSPRLAVDVVCWLGLAAAPAFALMAWISAIGSPGTTICSAVPAFVPINDMALMYLLMSFFHLSPWLKLLPARSQHRNAPIRKTEGD